jgi:hypothetical protein
MALHYRAGPADSMGMSANDATMLSKERDRHHDECRSDGFQWCPECGTLLVWDLPAATPATPSAEAWTPTVGDCPPLTPRQLD